MKRINIILCALVLLLSVACDRNVDFQHETFVTFDDVTYSVNENVGSISLPVSVYNPSGKEIQVTVLGVDGTGEKGAAEGVDYEIVSPASGILTFAPSDTTLYVEISLKHDKVLTGTKNFQVQINSATEGINVGGFNLATVKILDNEHPLAHLIGEWSGTLGTYFQELSFETVINIEAVDDDDTFTQLRIDAGIEPMVSKASNVKYSATSPDGVMIVLQSEQLTGYENYYLLGIELSSSGMKQADEFGFVYDKGKLFLGAPYALMVPGAMENGEDAIYDMYVEGEFTKK